MKVVNPYAVAWIVAMGDEDLPEDQQTAFEYRQTSAAEQTFLLNMRGMSGTGTLTASALTIGLTGNTRNFAPVDKAGNPVAMERDMAAKPIFEQLRPWTDKCLSFIPQTQRDHFAAAILYNKAQEEPIAKNS